MYRHNLRIGIGQKHWFFKLALFEGQVKLLTALTSKLLTSVCLRPHDCTKTNMAVLVVPRDQWSESRMCNGGAHEIALICWLVRTCSFVLDVVNILWCCGLRLLQKTIRIVTSWHWNTVRGMRVVWLVRLVVNMTCCTATLQYSACPVTVLLLVSCSVIHASWVVCVRVCVRLSVCLCVHRTRVVSSADTVVTSTRSSLGSTTRLRYWHWHCSCCVPTTTIVWTGIQADLALGGNFFHSHPQSTHIWYQNVQLTFQRQFRQTFTEAEQDSKWKHKPQNPYIQVVAKKGFPMVFPRMRTKQVQWQNWDGGCRSFLFSHFSSLFSSRTSRKLL